jgi:hypothetical protein
MWQPPRIPSSRDRPLRSIWYSSLHTSNPCASADANCRHGLQAVVIASIYNLLLARADSCYEFDAALKRTAMVRVEDASSQFGARILANGPQPHYYGRDDGGRANKPAIKEKGTWRVNDEAADLELK